MSTRAGDVIEAWPLFQAVCGGSLPTPALRSCRELHFGKVPLMRAKELNRVWHSRFPEVGGGGSRVCYAAEHGGRWYAAAVWTNPTSPKLPQLGWLMLKRFAVADDAPPFSAGRMMGWMVREVLARFPNVLALVSYSDPDTHTGTIYRATGWMKDGESNRDRNGVRGGWHSRERRHTANERCRRVVRWLYILRVGPLKRTGEF